MERRGLRPFLKWVGGKRQLLPVLRRYYPPAHGAYFEPFVGSGAVFFDLLAQGHLDGRAITLSDDNADLIGCYARVADSLDPVLAALEQLAVGHATNGATITYACATRGSIRSARIGAQPAAMSRAIPLNSPPC